MSKCAPPEETPTGAEATSPSSPGGAKRHPLQGALKGLVRVMPGTDLTQPADPDWGDAAERD